MTIREAQLPGDKRAIIELAARFLEGTRYGELLAGASWASVAELVERVYLSGVIFVAEVQREVLPGEVPGARIVQVDLVGMIALVCGPHPVTAQIVCEELAWWVNPEHRRSRIGPALLGRAEDWARQNGAIMLKMVAPAGSDVSRYYERHGYEAVETAFVKRL